MRVLPALIARKAMPAGGVDLPSASLPQHSALASACFSAHVKSSPAEMCEYAVPLGASHWPYSQYPKHSAFPRMSRTQVWRQPALIADFSPSGTCNRPFPLEPQQTPVRSSASPHEW